MKIQDYGMQMSAMHSSALRQETRAAVQVWTAPQPAVSNSVTLSQAGREAQATDEGEAAVDADPRFDLLRRMIEIMTGRSLRTLTPEDLRAITTSSGSAEPQASAAATTPATASAGFGIDLQVSTSRTESESTAFAATGTVHTADGREIAFQVHLSLSQSRHEESSIRLRAGDAPATTDPLILNFSGASAQLTDQRFAFDLDADGQTEQVHLASGGSGFLVFDRNGDGQANDGRELFGPTSGDGFAELAALDDDGNGWIDEADTAFSQLGLWQQGNDRLLRLSEAGVGALAVAHVATPFSLRGADQNLQGQLRSSGVFLQESGRAGTIQHVDLSI